MAAWNVGETRRLIEQVFGRDQLYKAKASLRSLDDRQIYSRIHYQDATAAVQEFVERHLSGEASLLLDVATDEEGSTEFNYFLRKVGAYLTACVQSMHAMPDILAFAIYYSLGMNLSARPLPAKAVSAKSVGPLLVGSPNVSDLGRLLTEVSTGGTSAHLAAIANKAKHRSVVFPALNEDWSGERAKRHAVVFEAFEYEGNHYPQVFADEFLEAEYNRVSPLVNAAGHAMSAVLRERAK